MNTHALGVTLQPRLVNLRKRSALVKFGGANETGNPLTPFSALDQDLELPDNVRNGIAQIHERINKRKCLEALNIAEEYFNGRIGLIVYLDSKSPFDMANKPRLSIYPHTKSAILHVHKGRTIWLYDFQTPDSGNAE